MRGKLFITYIFSVTLVLIYINPVQATEDYTSPSFIDSFEEDITGDGLREYFKLQGSFLSEDSSYYQNIWLEISSPFSKEWTISLKGGYDPKISVYDVNHDQVFDILYQVALDEENNQYFTQAYSLKNGTIEQIELPENKQIEGKYIDDFRISLSFHQNDRPIQIPVADHNALIENKLYNKKGKVLREEKAVVEAIKNYIPTLISESKGYGLNSVQEIKSIDGNELLGSVETLWYYDKTKWIILKNTWQPISPSG